jgi:hypothetical protein
MYEVAIWHLCCDPVCTSEAVGRLAGAPSRQAVTSAASCGGKFCGSRRRSPAATLQHHGSEDVARLSGLGKTELRTLHTVGHVHVFKQPNSSPRDGCWLNDVAHADEHWKLDFEHAANSTLQCSV